MEYIMFLDKETGKIKEVRASDFGAEEILQKTIEKYPKVLSIPAFGEIVPLMTEYQVSTGSIDLIAFDKGGRIYLIETKLHRNYDKRKALAQIIEYASQIAMHETFEVFKNKVLNRKGKSVEEIIKENFKENCNEILDKLRASFEREEFVLVLVMDEFDVPLRDMVSFLNRHSDLSIIGVEVKRYALDEKRDIFVPSAVGVEEKKGVKTPKTLITKDEFEKRYSDLGLGDIARRIISLFDLAQDKYDEVRIVPTPQSYVLRIHGNEIQIGFNVDPKKEHSVWVFNPKLYGNVGRVGRELNLKTSMPTSKNFGKVIDFSGIEGLKRAVEKLEVLIEGLASAGIKEDGAREMN